MVRSGGTLRHIGGEGVEVRRVGGEVCGLGLSIEQLSSFLLFVFYEFCACHSSPRWRRL